MGAGVSHLFQGHVDDVVRPEQTAGVVNAGDSHWNINIGVCRSGTVWG